MVAEDYNQVASLVYYETNNHRHLDWHSPLERINLPNCWVLAEGDSIYAVLACPEDPPNVAWVSFLGIITACLGRRHGCCYGKKRAATWHSKTNRFVLPQLPSDTITV